MSNLSASPNNKSKFSLQHDVSARWSESLVREVLSLAYLIDAIYILLSFSCFFSLPLLLDVPFFFFFLFLNKTSLSGYSATSASAVIVIYKAWSGEQSSWVTFSSARLVVNMLWTFVSGRGEGTKNACGKESCACQHFKIPRGGVTADV